MKILVTGAAGFIGSNLVDHLLKEGHSVVGIDSFHPHYDEEIKHNNLKRAGQSSRFLFFQGDIRNGPELLKIMKGEAIETVVHLAAEVGSRASVADPFRFYRVNIEGTQTLLDQCVSASVSRFIMASTSTVYAESPNGLYKEEGSVAAPMTPYGISKLANEAMCRAHSKMNDLKVVVLRIFSTYGPRQRPDLVIHRFMRLIFEGKPIEVFAPQGSFRDYVHVSDCVRAISAALSHARPFDIFNVASGKRTTISDLIETLQRVMGLEADIQTLGHPPSEPKGGVGSIIKARQGLGYIPQVGLEPGVADFYKWFLKRSGRGNV